MSLGLANPHLQRAAALREEARVARLTARTLQRDVDRRNFIRRADELDAEASVFEEFARNERSAA
jgi:hypothetical protein